MSSSMMQRLPVLEGLFCPTTLVTQFDDRTSSVKLRDLFRRSEVTDPK